MTKPEFKVGDRVAAYAGVRIVGVIISDPRLFSGNFEIESLDGKTTIFVHPKQCRRLVKKKRTEYIFL